MKQVIKYRCDDCGKLFDKEDICLEHEQRHIMINKANEMLEDGHTLQEINDETNIWYNVPDHLKNVTTENCFIIEYWQCCDKPAYKIDYIYFDGKVRVWGCGSWNGYYGNEVSLQSSNLKDPRPKEELFIDKRWGR